MTSLEEAVVEEVFGMSTECEWPPLKVAVIDGMSTL